ncbi:MAG: hypothetical protein GF311_11395 [Candidatus Lokiarchaeota archaeon]|nr:hypothetical protein [Candidatus Lokiarchaeota archaeon]
MEALFLTITKIHTAAAMHAGDPFLEIKETFEDFNYGRKLSPYLTGSSFPTQKTLNIFYSVIEEWFSNDLNIASIISGDYMTGNIPFYLDALASLENLKMQIDLSRRAFHGMRRTQTTINGYLSLWYQDEYKAWTTIVLGRETLFTEVLSFESLEDSLFNKNFGGGIFQTQHMKRNNKQSCSLYHLLLTNNKYHQTLEQTMSATDQRILKSGVASLVNMGLNGEGSGPNGEITKADIKTLFSNSQGHPILFGIKSRKSGNHESGIPILTTYDEEGNAIYGLWDYHFSNVDPVINDDFDSKLAKFNEKIGNYRFALEYYKESPNSEKKAFLEFLKSFKCHNLKENFYDDAEQFANDLDAWTHINPKIAKSNLFSRITKYYTNNARVLFKIEQLKTFITINKFL